MVSTRCVVVTVTGASDDLIEVGGAIGEEFPFYTPQGSRGRDEGKLLVFSEGTVLRVKYDGLWRVTRVAEGSAEFSKKEGSEERNTFDVVTLRGDLRWVVLGTKFVKASGS